MIQRWIWRDASRHAHKLLSFAETEADGGRDLARAAETTKDPVLRRLYLVHAADEQRHAAMFRDRGTAVLQTLAGRTESGFLATTFAPGERGLDDVHVDGQSDDSLLAFLHLSEKTAAVRFTQYRDALPPDSPTRTVFEQILHDEKFHMTYTGAQLTRVAPLHHRRALWYARLGRMWKGYLRFAVALAGVMGSVVLTVVYFTVLVPFAVAARRAARREPKGWHPLKPEKHARSGEY